MDQFLQENKNKNIGFRYITEESTVYIGVGYDDGSWFASYRVKYHHQPISCYRPIDKVKFETPNNQYYIYVDDQGSKKNKFVISYEKLLKSLECLNLYGSVRSISEKYDIKLNSRMFSDCTYIYIHYKYDLSVIPDTCLCVNITGIPTDAYLFDMLPTEGYENLLSIPKVSYIYDNGYCDHSCKNIYAEFIEKNKQRKKSARK